jgi:spermidine/putrescine-binding protein
MFPLSRHTRDRSREKRPHTRRGGESLGVSENRDGVSGAFRVVRGSRLLIFLPFSVLAALIAVLALGPGCSREQHESLLPNTVQFPTNEGRLTAEAGPPILTVLCRPEYLPEALLADFTTQTGVMVVIANPADHPDLMVADGSFDLALVDSLSLPPLIDQNLLAKIDRAAIPNSARISPPFSADPLDPDGTFSVPFLWGTFGIVVNRNVITDPEIEWGLLFDRSFSGKIDMPDDIRLLLEAALRDLGTFLGEADTDTLNRAADLLYEQKKIVRGYFQIPEIIDHLAENSSDLSYIDSPSALLAIQRNAVLEYVVPASGAPLWLLVWVIPATSENADSARRLIDFFLDPGRIAAVSNINRIANTVDDSKPYLDDGLAGMPTIILPDGMSARCSLPGPTDLETENFMMRLRDDFMLK